MSRDHSAAKKFRDVVASIARSEIEKMFPADRYAKVHEIHEDQRRVIVHYNGEEEENLVSVPYNSVKPAYVGQWVRIGGSPGDRHVIDTLGGTAAEERAEEVHEESPIYPKWFQHSPRMLDTGPILTRPDEYETLTINQSSICGSVVRIPGKVAISSAVVHLTKGGSGRFRVALYRMTSTFGAELLTQTAETLPTYNSDQTVDFENYVTLDRGDEVLVALHNRTGSTIESTGWSHKVTPPLHPDDALSYARTGQTSLPSSINSVQWNYRWNDRLWYLRLVIAE